MMRWSAGSSVAVRRGGMLMAMLPLLLGADRPEVEHPLESTLAKVPGHSALLFAELHDGGPEAVHSLRADERFAVGSSFKLFILGTLIDEVNHRRRRAEDVLALRHEWIGPPASEMAAWPLGSPATLHTYALKMISISDNTATDHLLYLLGRQRIEQQMQSMGHRHPEWNRPLLSTREMVMLRDKNAFARTEHWQKLDETGRRRFLDKEVAGQHDFETVDFDTAAYNVAEWYATPMDMAHALNWIRLNTGASLTGGPLLEILTVEQKLHHDPQAWPFVGFKGGSEDQILCGNWLLRHRNGRWFTYHVYFNNPAARLDQPAAIAAMQEAFELISAALE